MMQVDPDPKTPSLHAFLEKLRRVEFDVHGSADPEPQAAVERFLEAAGPARANWPRPKLNQIEGWADLMRKDPAWSRRCVLAALARFKGLDRESRAISEAREDAREEGAVDVIKAADAASYANLRVRHHIADLMTALLRRRLPLTEQDMLSILAAATAGEGYGHIGGVTADAATRQSEIYLKDHPLTERLREALQGLRNSFLKNSRHGRMGVRIDLLLADDTGDADSPPPIRLLAMPPAGPVGSSAVLADVKRRLGLAGPPEPMQTTATGPDVFPLRDDSPLREEHEVLSGMFERFTQEHEHWGFGFDRDPIGLDILASDADTCGRYYLACCERSVARRENSGDSALHPAAQSVHGARNSIYTLGKLPEVTVDDRAMAFDAMVLAGAISIGDHYGVGFEPWMVDLAERHASDHDLSAGERHLLYRIICGMLDQPPLGILPQQAARLARLVDGDDATLLLVPGEHWTDAVHRDLCDLPLTMQQRWLDLLREAAKATGGKPSRSWCKRVSQIIDLIGVVEFRRLVGDWLTLVPRWGSSLPTLAGLFGDDVREDRLHPGNATVLRGLLWALGVAGDPAAASGVVTLLRVALQKVPGIGPRDPKLANACVWSLGEMAGSEDEAVRDAAMGQLARLKARVTFRTTLNAIEKALDKAAERAGVSREDLEELGVPGFGFEGGVRRESIGGAGVELRVEGNKVVTTWTNDKGKPVKSPPAAVKRGFKENLKEVQQAARDAEGILLAGRDRLDNLYLQQKTWTLADWRERYLGHGLLGTLARRLIWEVDGEAVLFPPPLAPHVNAGPPATQPDATNVQGEPVSLADTAGVRLWHPIGHGVERVRAWRDRLADLGITQPFKQAHREVYPLTQAERNTRIYSNRFAAHIVRQHQFNALCAARGWRNRLRLMVDDAYQPPHRDLPLHGLRAEFWVEPVGDDYGTDTTESGAYLHLGTDQVRFYRTGAEANYVHALGGGYTTSGSADEADNHPLPLDEVPPLVLSEVLRDCDLFVGVASVGNDPTWADGGPDGRFRDYWAGYSFGDLSQTAQTRKAVLERLVPRLAIADRCTLTEKFLVVRGDVRTYKVHLGSGNILMEPGDRYLCIVPSSGLAARGEGVHLPFEGDRTLSIILSKAMLLAADSKITDPTILSQIGRPTTAT